MAFKRMDRGTLEDWETVGEAVNRWQSHLPNRIKAMLLQLDDQVDGFYVTQLQHSLQTATHAVRDGASEELIMAALCHDIGTAISIENHPAIAAEILKPYVTYDVYEIVRTHQDFQGRHYYELIGKNAEARQQYRNESWYQTACRFSDEWDQASFDPHYDTLPFEYFEPIIDRVFKEPRQQIWIRQKISAARRWAKLKRWLGKLLRIQ